MIGNNKIFSTFIYMKFDHFIKENKKTITTNLFLHILKTLIFQFTVVSLVIEDPII